MPEHTTRYSSIVSSDVYPKVQPAQVLLSDSGHGGQVPDEDGDEVDGYDEGV